MRPKKDIVTKNYFPTGSDLLDILVGGGEGFGYPLGKIVNFVGDKSSGKCIKNSYIITKKGFEKIDDIGLTQDYGESDYNELVSVEKDKCEGVNKFWREEVCNTIKIKTSNGFELEGTYEHPILTLNNKCEYQLKKLSELKKEDICIIGKGNNYFPERPYKINYTKKGKSKFSNNSKSIDIPSIVNENIGTFLGYYIADGSRADNFINIASTKEYCKKELDKIISNEFGIETNHACGSTTIHSIELRNFLDYLLGNPECFTARYKKVPECILQSTKSVQCAFLRALIDNDGCKGKSNTLTYYTASQELSNQVQLMLLNLGIYSSRIGTYGATVNGKFYDNTYYDVSIGGLDLKLYAQLIGSKKYDFTETLNLSENDTKKCDKDSIPFLKNRMESDISILRKKLNWPINGKIDLYKGINRFPRYLFAGKTNITIPLLKDFITKFEPFEELIDLSFYRNILEKDYRYVTIKEIEKKTEKTDVYDLHIPNGHLFWSNGFISHNTFLACEVIAAAYHNEKYKSKLKWVYDDSESGFSFDTKHLYGFEIMPLESKKRTKSKTVEEAYCNVRNFFENLSDEEFGIYTIDSLDALNDKEGLKIADEQFTKFKKRKESPSEKEEKEKGSYRMGKAKYLSNTFFPNLADLIEKKNGLLIIISQVRCNLDPFSFEKYSRAGGKALDFYAHTVLWLANVNKIVKKDRAIGVTIKASNNKSKTPRPYRSCFVKILFDYGIDNIQSNIDYSFDLLTPQGKLIKNPKCKWSDKELNLIGIKKFLSEWHIEDEYRKKVAPKLKLSEVKNYLEKDCPYDSIKKAYIAEFSDIMSRVDMMSFVIKYNLINILKKKVVDKWEAIENSVKSNLPPKYSSD